MSTYPQHHLPEDWLAAWASGSLDEARSLMVAVHMTYCPVCRDRGSLAEVVAADALLQADASDPPLEDDGLASLMDRLDDPEPQPTTNMPSMVDATTDEEAGWPAPLKPFVKGQKYRWLAPFTSGIDLPHETTGSLPLRLIRMRAGSHLPHVNGGEECAVILRGGWSDDNGHYERGDLFYSSGEVEHDQTIDAAEDCYALVLNEHKTTPLGIIRLLGWMFKV